MTVAGLRSNFEHDCHFGARQYSFEQVGFVFEDAFLMLHDRVDGPPCRFAQYGGFDGKLDAALPYRNNFDKIFPEIVADMADIHSVVQPDIL